MGLAVGAVRARREASPSQGRTTKKQKVICSFLTTRMWAALRRHSTHIEMSSIKHLLYFWSRDGSAARVLVRWRALYTAASLPFSREKDAEQTSLMDDTWWRWKRRPSAAVAIAFCQAVRATPSTSTPLAYRPLALAAAAPR